MNWLRSVTDRLARRKPRSVRDTIAEARKASDGIKRTTRHNPEGPDADLRYTPAGPGGP